MRNGLKKNQFNMKKITYRMAEASIIEFQTGYLRTLNAQSIKTVLAMVRERMKVDPFSSIEEEP